MAGKHDRHETSDEQPPAKVGRIDWREVFTCPVCREIPTATPPLQINPCGHLICSPCLGKLRELHRHNTKCPVCREHAKSITDICFFARRYWESLELPCPHEGCPAVINVKTYNLHVECCCYAPVLSACGSVTVPKSDAYTHCDTCKELREFHKGIKPGTFLKVKAVDGFNDHQFFSKLDGMFFMAVVMGIVGDTVVMSTMHSDGRGYGDLTISLSKFNFLVHKPPVRTFKVGDMIGRCKTVESWKASEHVIPLFTVVSIDKENPQLVKTDKGLVVDMTNNWGYQVKLKE